MPGLQAETIAALCFDLNSGARQRLLALEQLGFTLAMADYGTGYCGLVRFTPSAWAPKVGLAA